MCHVKSPEVTLDQDLRGTSHPVAADFNLVIVLSKCKLYVADNTGELIYSLQLPVIY